MASDQTVEILVKFFEFGYKLNITSLKVIRNPSVYLEVPVNKKNITATYFAIIVLILLQLAFARDLLINYESMADEDVIFNFCLISMGFGVLGPQIWSIWNLESSKSLINTFLRFNQHLGELVHLKKITK